jgi:hypothetical protein
MREASVALQGGDTVDGLHVVLGVTGDAGSAGLRELVTRGGVSVGLRAAGVGKAMWVWNTSGRTQRTPRACATHAGEPRSCTTVSMSPTRNGVRGCCRSRMP